MHIPSLYAAMRTINVSSAEKSVLVNLTFHAGAKSQLAWPSIATMALETRLSKATVSRSIKGLVKKSYIERTKSGGKNRGSTHYILKILSSPSMDRAELSPNDAVESASLFLDQFKKMEMAV